MYEWIKWLHLSGGIIWLGGMTVLLLAVRPVAIAQLAPPERLPLMAAVLGRFFAWVWGSMTVLLASGLWMFSTADLSLAPRGWHAMAGLGGLMCLIFVHLWFAPFRRLKQAVAQADWAAAGLALGQIHPLVLTNFALGWLAVAAVLVWR